MEACHHLVSFGRGAGGIRIPEDTIRFVGHAMRRKYNVRVSLTLKRDYAEVGFLPMYSIMGSRQAAPPASITGDGVVPQLQYTFVFHHRVICPDAQALPGLVGDNTVLARWARTVQHQMGAAALGNKQVINKKLSRGIHCNRFAAAW